MRDTYREMMAVADACWALQMARDRLKEAGAVVALAKVRRALKSCDGAHRHAIRRWLRDDCPPRRRRRA